MDERISIITPDHVELDFEIAGIGSRLLAFVMDQVLLYLGILTIVLLMMIAGGVNIFSNTAQQWSGTIATTLLVFIIFLLNWGYFVAFEALNMGQTPGKRWTGIRVVQDSGLPIGWREAALRNFARIADIMPPPACFVGGLAILLSKRGKRLGDLLAGTMVIREDFGQTARGGTARWEAAWIARAEKGRFVKSIVLADLKIEASQMQMVRRFLERRDSLPLVQRQNLAWKIAQPFLKAMGEDPVDLETRSDRYIVSERVLSDILIRANAANRPNATANTDVAETKREQWAAFDREIADIAKSGARGLRLLRPNHLVRIIASYRQLAGDVARARSLGRDSVLVRRLNNTAIRAHNVLYGYHRSRTRTGGPSWLVRFPIAVRAHAMAVLFSAVMTFGPSVVTYVAVQLHPDLGYDLVPSGFLDFEPARDVSLHNIPGLARPVAASTIMTNNIQVTLLAFGLGMTAGLGTSLILLTNGMQLGAVAGWMTSRGNSRALWGWIMPHGGTELLAIVLSGAAGFILAGALIAPGNARRSVALARVAKDALAIILGVMGMLVVAGLIEGFVSPSSIGYTARIVVLAISLVGWFLYLGFAGRKEMGKSEISKMHDS